MKIKSALIDLDDTLCDTQGVYHDALHQCHKVFTSHTRVELSFKEFEELYNKAKEETNILVPNSAARHNRTIYFQKLAENFRLKTDLELVYHLQESYSNFVSQNIKLFPGALELLQWLRQNGIKTVIISDGNTHTKVSKIHSLQIAKYVDFLVTSEEVGVGKPAPQSFLLGLNKSGANPDEAIYLGNIAESDIYGANRVGLVTIQLSIQRNNATLPVKAEYHPRYSIDRLEQVIDIIKYLEGTLN